MKRLIAIITIILLCVLSVSAQQVSRDINLLISQSESAKKSYGVNSDEYLASLDSIVQSAFEQQKYDIAFKYRNIHIDIIANKEGKESLNYAIDLSRLGNVASQLHPNNLQIAIDYHLKAYNLFDKLKVYDHIFYLVTTGQLSNLYANTGQYDLALQYQDKHLMCIKKVEGTISISYLNACNVAINIADAAGSNALIDKYSKEILQNTSKLTNENFANYQFAISAKHTVLWRQEKYQDAIKTIIDYLAKVQNFIGNNNTDYVSGLTQLSTDYMVVGKYQESIDASLKAIKIIEVLCQGDIKAIRQNRLYYTACNTLATIYGVIPNEVEEFKYEKEVCEILKASHQEQTADYMEALVNVFITAASIGEYNYALSIANEVEALIPKYSSSPNEDMFKFIGYMYDVTAKIGKYDMALEYCEKGLGIIPYIYQGDDLLFNQSVLYVAQIQAYIELNNNEEANRLISLARSSLDNIKDQSHIVIKLEKAQLMRLEGISTEDYAKAIECISGALSQYHSIESLLQSKRNKSPQNKGNSVQYVDDNQLELQYELQRIQSSASVAYVNRGLCYMNHGQYELAYADFTSASKLIEITKSKNSSDYITTQNNVAICEMSMGRYVAAIKTLDDISAITRQQYGENSYLYAVCLQNYGVYYQSVFDYEKLVEVTSTAKAIYEKLYGSSSENYAAASANLGMAYTWLGNHTRAEENLSEAYAIISKQPNGTSNLLLAKVLQNLGNLYCAQGKYQEADKAYTEAKDIVARVCGEYSIEMATLLAGYGRECAVLGLEASVVCFDGVLSIVKKLNMYANPISTYSSVLYGLSCLINNKTPNPEYPQIAMNILKEYYGYNFAFLTEDDRARVWDVLQNNKNVLFSLKDDINMDTSLYDYCLFSKSLLLSTSTNFGKAVVNSGNENLIAQYNRLQMLKKEQIIQSSKASTNDPATEVAQLEREIISQLKQDNGYTNELNYTVSDVVEALGKNEVAIEFVDYTNLKTDKAEYIALILRKGWKEPKIVPLFEEAKINAFIKRTPKEMYANSYVGKQLYKLIWEPISEYVNDGDIVYFSPTGKLYTLALESLCSPTGEPLNELFNMIRVTSTREVCMTDTTDLPQDAIIYGGLQYDVTPAQMATISRSMEHIDSESVVFTNNSDTRAGWGYLEGTKKEAEYIADLLGQSHIKHKLYSGEYGNEESFKALSGEKHNLIHLATHGFFMPNQTAKHHTFTSMIQAMGQPGQAQFDVIDPMMRSGLILAGGNNVWTGIDISGNIEDGILTAAEIAAMNLHGTDIVVLSACETGLGDISGDGVFGLQRAFKQAGVKTLIMSLWRVDDAATELMMKTFYENLLAGKSKREAFSIAQNTVRNNENFTNPHYWAGFIMLD